MTRGDIIKAKGLLAVKRTKEAAEWKAARKLHRICFWTRPFGHEWGPARGQGCLICGKSFGPAHD